jgi:hypothetical protein
MTDTPARPTPEQRALFAAQAAERHQQAEDRVTDLKAELANLPSLRRLHARWQHAHRRPFMTPEQLDAHETRLKGELKSRTTKPRRRRKES